MLTRRNPLTHGWAWERRGGAPWRQPPPRRAVHHNTGLARLLEGWERERIKGTAGGNPFFGGVGESRPNQLCCRKEDLHVPDVHEQEHQGPTPPGSPSCDGHVAHPQSRPCGAGSVSLCMQERPFLGADPLCTVSWQDSETHQHTGAADTTDGSSGLGCDDACTEIQRWLPDQGRTIVTRATLT